MHMNHLNSISISHNKHYKGAKLKNDKNIKPLVKLDANNRIGGIMVMVLAPSVVDHGFDPRSGQIKDYKFCICCFSASHLKKKCI
jgi:hypothetical protein